MSTPLPLETVKKPASRAECRGPGICPRVSCKFHLALEVTAAQTIQTPTKSWRLKGRTLSDQRQVNQLAKDIVDWLLAGNPSCALDLAEDDEQLLREVGDLWNVSRERIRQLESKALVTLRKNQHLRLVHQEMEESIAARRPPAISEEETAEKSLSTDVDRAAEKFAGKVGNPPVLRIFGAFERRRKTA